MSCETFGGVTPLARNRRNPITTHYYYYYYYYYYGWKKCVPCKYFVRILRGINFLAKPPGSTLHGYLSEILARSCQDVGKILAKILTRYCQKLQDAMVKSYQESHVSKKNLTKKPNMARKILLRSRIWQAKNCYELLDIEKK